MKRTQQSVLLAGLLALSLAACSSTPWRNTSGTTPAANPSVGSPAGSSDPVTDPGPNGASANGGPSEKSNTSANGTSGQN